MTKSELESKHLAELHTLAAEAGVPRYRMLRREELVQKLLSEESESQPRREREPGGERSQRRRSRGGESRPRRPRSDRPERAEPPKPPATAEESESDVRETEAPVSPRREQRPAEPAARASSAGPSRPRRKRRRRFGRKRKELRLSDLLLPAVPGRQTIVYGETREACTALLRELASELAGTNGTDPVALLVDPGPEELAEWRREVPQAEIVAAAQARHAEDALAQAARRAQSGESVVVLIDSLTRFGEAFEDAESAKGLLEGSNGSGASVTIVAALERR